VSTRVGFELIHASKSVDTIAVKFGIEQSVTLWRIRRQSVNESRRPELIVKYRTELNHLVSISEDQEKAAIGSSLAMSAYFIVLGQCSDAAKVLDELLSKDNQEFRRVLETEFVDKKNQPSTDVDGTISYLTSLRDQLKNWRE
jgi:hypothetical protein